MIKIKPTMVRVGEYLLDIDDIRLLEKWDEMGVNIKGDWCILVTFTDQSTKKIRFGEERVRDVMFRRLCDELEGFNLN